MMIHSTRITRAKGTYSARRISKSMRRFIPNTLLRSRLILRRKKHQRERQMFFSRLRKLQKATKDSTKLFPPSRLPIHLFQSAGKRGAYLPRSIGYHVDALSQPARGNTV